jgi:putative protease
MPALHAFLWSLKVDRLDFLKAFESQDWDDLDEVVIEIARDELPELSAGLAGLAARVGRERIRLALPILTRGWEEEDLRHKIAALRAAGWRKWEAANLSAWEFLELGRNAPHDVSADWPVYVLNLAAGEAVLGSGVSRVTLSPEDGLRNYRDLLAKLGARASVVVYQDTPLFLSETCAYASLRGGCQGRSRCPRPALKLVSGFGDRLLALTEHCRTVVLNEQPFCIAQRLRELREAGAVRLRADFILRSYSPAEVRALWRMIRAGQAPAASHAANFDRGLL